MVTRKKSLCVFSTDATIVGLPTQHMSAQEMFLSSIFNLQLAEPTDAEPADTEGCLDSSRLHMYIGGEDVDLRLEFYKVSFQISGLLTMHLFIVLMWSCQV